MGREVGVNWEHAVWIHAGYPPQKVGWFELVEGYAGWCLETAGI